MQLGEAGAGLGPELMHQMAAVGICHQLRDMLEGFTVDVDTCNSSESADLASKIGYEMGLWTGNLVLELNAMAAAYRELFPQAASDEKVGA